MEIKDRRTHTHNHTDTHTQSVALWSSSGALTNWSELGMCMDFEGTDRGSGRFFTTRTPRWGPLGGPGCWRGAGCSRRCRVAALDETSTSRSVLVYCVCVCLGGDQSGRKYAWCWFFLFHLEHKLWSLPRSVCVGGNKNNIILRPYLHWPKCSTWQLQQATAWRRTWWELQSISFRFTFCYFFLWFITEHDSRQKAFFKQS